LGLPFGINNIHIGNYKHIYVFVCFTPTKPLWLLSSAFFQGK
jgi:hypothetical protein